MRKGRGRREEGEDGEREIFFLSCFAFIRHAFGRLICRIFAPKNREKTLGRILRDPHFKG